MRSLRGLAILTFSAAFWPASAAAASTAEILTCIEVADSTARLSCFDRQAAALAAAQSKGNSDAAAPMAGTVNALPAVKKLTPEQKIGLTRDKVDAMEAPPGAAPEPPLQDFTAVIKSVSRDANQRQVFELDNGQVWHQSERKVDFSVKPGQTVHITRAALGSFWLSPNPHVATRVARVR